MGLFDSLRKAWGGTKADPAPSATPTPATYKPAPRAGSAESVTEAPNENAALQALARITDQTELKRVAEDAWRYYEVRKAALKRIEDEEFLAHRAIKDQVIPVKICAVDLIDSPKLLLDVCREERRTPAWREVVEYAELRARHIIEGLDDQELLAQFAVCDSTSCRWAATERLNDQAVLARIALGDAEHSDGWTRRRAIARLTDRDDLQKVLDKNAAWSWGDEYKEAEARLAELDGAGTENPVAG